MALTTSNRKLLWARSGGLCALCKRHLTEESTGADPAVVLGEEAHIVSPRPTGPRYRPLPPDQIDDPGNLILLCPTDHTTVDGQVDRYSEDELRRLKREHEDWIRERPGAALPTIRIRDLDPGAATMLHVAETGGQLMHEIGGSLALGTVRPDPLADEEVDLIAGFFESVIDLGDLWNEFGPGERLRSEHDLDDQITSLRDAGFVVYAGTRRQVLEGGVAGPQPWTAATVAVFRWDDPTIQAAHDVD